MKYFAVCDTPIGSIDYICYSAKNITEAKSIHDEWIAFKKQKGESISYSQVIPEYRVSSYYDNNLPILDSVIGEVLYRNWKKH